MEVLLTLVWLVGGSWLISDFFKRRRIGELQRDVEAAASDLVRTRARVLSAVNRDLDAFSAAAEERGDATPTFNANELVAAQLWMLDSLPYLAPDPDDFETRLHWLRRAVELLEEQANAGSYLHARSGTLAVMERDVERLRAEGGLDDEALRQLLFSRDRPTGVQRD
mgnify:CR=1 FL=1